LARKNWVYFGFHKEMVDALDEIVRKEGAKYGIDDNKQLARKGTVTFITVPMKRDIMPTI
jgi:hypothetical protein